MICRQRAAYEQLPASAIQHLACNKSSYKVFVQAAAAVAAMAGKFKDAQAPPIQLFHAILQVSLL